MVKVTSVALCAVILWAAGSWSAAEQAGAKTADQKKDEKKTDDKKKPEEKKKDEVKAIEKTATVKTLTEKNKYAKVDLAAGEKLLVQLPSNPSTGYTWVITSKENPKFILDGKPVYTRDEGQEIGGGGLMTFTFMSLGAGDAEVELQYLRPFEKGRQPEKTFSFMVRIR